MKRIEKIPATYVEQVQERSIKRVAIYACVSTMYDIHNDHEAIIAPFVHELVQERLKQPLYSGKLMLSDKIICTRCG